MASQLDFRRVQVVRALRRMAAWTLLLPVLRRAGLTRAVGSRILPAPSDSPLEHRRIKVGGLNLTVRAADVIAYTYDEYEPVTASWLRREAAEARRIADVGANVGYLTLVMHGAAPLDADIVAVEPSPFTLPLLLTNLRAHGADRVEVVAAALGRSWGMVKLEVSSHGGNDSFFGVPDHVQSLGAVTVATAPAAVLGRIDLMKVDVEGAELAVLEGLDELPKSLLVEWNPVAQQRAGQSPSSLPEWLQDHGYRIEVLDDLANERISLEEAHLRAREAGWYCNLACHLAGA